MHSYDYIDSPLTDKYDFLIIMMIFSFDSSSNSIEAGHENFYNDSLINVLKNLININ